MTRRIAAVLAVLGLLLAFVQPASAAPLTSRLTVSPNSGRPGDTVELTFSCSKDDLPIRQLWSNVVDGFPQHPQYGSGTVTAKVLPDATPDKNGDYWVVLDCAHSYSIQPFTILS